MKVIIAGGRDFSDYELLKTRCNIILSTVTDVEIVCGMAKGADLLGKKYAEERGFKVKEFPADWNTNGKKAGPMRNTEMANYADALIAFWDGTSSGTGHMIEKAKQKGLKVRVIKY